MSVLSDLPNITQLTRVGVEFWIQFLISPSVLSVILVTEAQELNYLYFYQNQPPNYELVFNSDFPVRFSLWPFYPSYAWRSWWIVQGKPSPSQTVSSSNVPAVLSAQAEGTRTKNPGIRCPFLVYSRENGCAEVRLTMIWGTFLISMTCLLICEIRLIILPLPGKK